MAEMKKNRKLVIRLSVVFILHLLFKQGDFTFTSAFEISMRSLVFSLFFIVYWLLFWECCSYIYGKFMRITADKRVWYRKLAGATLVLLVLTVVGSVVFSWGYLAMDRYIFGITAQEDVNFLNPDIFSPSELFKMLEVNPELLFGILLLFVLVYGAHIFVTAVKNAKELEVIAAKQKKESISAQYLALKNQIDPHFFFNSLSVLSSLIYESTDLSASYITHLSRHYRNILEIRTEGLVTVNRELECLESYYFLIKIRHEAGISLLVNLSEHTRVQGKILPNVLQMLVENAVKHNAFNKDNPLVIEIVEDTDAIIVRNNLNKRRLLQESTGIGIDNIRKRYAIETSRDIIIEETGKHFVVKLPKIT